MSIAVVLIRCFTTVICCGCTTFVVVDSNMYGGGNQSYTRIIVAACHRHQLTSNFNRASLTTTSTVQTSWRSAFVLTACGPIHSQRALGNHMLPCFRLQQILPILLRDRTQALHYTCHSHTAYSVRFASCGLAQAFKR